MKKNPNPLNNRIAAAITEDDFKKFEAIAAREFRTVSQQLRLLIRRAILEDDANPNA